MMDFNSVARQRDHLSLGPPRHQARQGRPAHQLLLIPTRRHLNSPPHHLVSRLGHSVRGWSVFRGPVRLRVNFCCICSYLTTRRAMDWSQVAEGSPLSCLHRDNCSEQHVLSQASESCACGTCWNHPHPPTRGQDSALATSACSGGVAASSGQVGSGGRRLTPRVPCWQDRTGGKREGLDRRHRGWGVGGWEGWAVPEGKIRVSKFMKVPWKTVTARLHFLPICSRRKMQHSRAGTSMMPGITWLMWMFTPKSFILKLSVK